MIAIVVGLSFIVLLLAFRSLLVPLKAAAMNLTLGGRRLRGGDRGLPTRLGLVVDRPRSPDSDRQLRAPADVRDSLRALDGLRGVPLDPDARALRQHGDEKRAVIEGLANTGRVITSAAAIMVCVFTSFVLNGDPVVKEFGVGLAVAIAIDSTLVRCLLVPAVMVLLGDRAWWMPRWLERVVPHISIEGEEYFAARDARLAAAAAPKEPLRKRLSGRCSRSTCPNCADDAAHLRGPGRRRRAAWRDAERRCLAAAVFALAALTDGLDGYIARSRDSITNLRQVDGPARRQAADHRGAGLAGLLASA